MLNRLDTQQIATKARDFVRVQATYFNCHINGEDLDKIGNFVLETLSKYEDNRHIQVTQYNPQTDRVEALQKL